MNHPIAFAKETWTINEIIEATEASLIIKDPKKMELE